MDKVTVIVPLHGIRTTADWQRTLSDAAQNLGWRCALDTWNYGQFSLLRFIRSKRREEQIRWFRNTYNTFMHDRSFPIDDNNLPSIVAHSFGTYILGYALLKYETIKFDKIILCGSILPEEFPWDVILDRGQVHALLNEFGNNDIWCRIVHWFVSGAGASGQKGFRLNHPSLIQHRFQFDHSEYFDVAHMRENWLKFIGEEIAVRPRESFPTHPLRRNLPWGLYGVYLVVFLLLVTLFGVVWKFETAKMPPQTPNQGLATVESPNSPSPSAAALKPTKVYSEAEKNGISEALYALSLAFTDEALKSVDETASFSELWYAQISAMQSGKVKAIDTKALMAKLNQIRQLEQDFENDWDKVHAKYVVFQNELTPLYGGGDEGGRKRSNFRESMDEISTGISVVAGVQGHDDKSLLGLTLTLMNGPLRIFVKNSQEFGGWVNDCNQRIDGLRRSVLNR
jgi:hypothetical protein